MGGNATSTFDGSHFSANPLACDTQRNDTVVDSSEAVAVVASNLQADDPFQLDISTVEMHVVSDDLWKHAATTFGQVIVSAVRNYLPLQLVDQVSIGWSDFIHHEFMMHSSISETRSSDDEPNTTDNTDSHHNTSLWLRLDFGSTKRSTILKKLRLLPASTMISIQLETMVTVLDQQASHVTNRKKKKIVLLRVAPTIRNIIDILDITTAGHSNNSTPGTGMSVAGLLPIDALNKPVYARSSAGDHSEEEDSSMYDPKNRVSNLVNSFHMTVCLLCMEVIIDLAMLVMFCLTIISPVRFLRLLYTLLEPENKLPLRIMQHTMSSIKYMDGHLLKYRREVAVPCNVIAKSIKCKLLNPSSYDDYNDYHWFYFNFHTSHEQYFGQVLDSIDNKHYKPYVKLAKSSKKTLSLFPGCEAMEALLDERLHLHYLVVKLRYMRITADLSYRVASITSGTHVNTGECCVYAVDF